MSSPEVLLTQPIKPVPRPYFSDLYSSVIDSARVEYGDHAVLRPDIVTDGMAYIAAMLADERWAAFFDQQAQTSFVGDTALQASAVIPPSDEAATMAVPPSEVQPRLGIAEFGAGTAVFSAFVVQRIRNAMPAYVETIDIDPSTIPYAQYNVFRSMLQRSNSQDLALVRQGHWNQLLDYPQSFRLSYLNLPYLRVGEKIRSRYSGMPTPSMYVDGSDPLIHYRRLIPRVPDVMLPDGLAFIRTPKNTEGFDAVHEMARQALLGRIASIHTVEVFDETWMDERTGRGLIVDFSGAQPEHFTIGPDRYLGMVLTRSTGVDETSASCQ